MPHIFLSVFFVEYRKVYFVPNHYVRWETTQNIPLTIEYTIFDPITHMPDDS